MHTGWNYVDLRSSSRLNCAEEVEGKDTSGVRRNEMDEIDQAAISIADLDWPVPEMARGDTHGERAGREWPKEIARAGLASELRVVSFEEMKSTGSRGRDCKPDSMEGQAGTTRRGGWGDWMECGRGRGGARPGYGGGARERGNCILEVR